MGREFLVAPMVLLREGVLHGSRGPLFYANSEISKDPQIWDMIPLTEGHPKVGNEYVSANDEGILNKYGLGYVREPSFLGSLNAEGWFDIELTKKNGPRTYKKLMRGEPFDLSTGLGTTNVPAPEGSVHNGKPFTHYAVDYLADHVAVLHDVPGACSRADGCGVLVNAAGAVEEYEVLRDELTANTKDALGHGSNKRSEAGTEGKNKKPISDKQKEALDKLKSIYHTIKTTPALDGEGTVYHTGLNTTLLARLESAGYITGKIYLGGKVVDLKIVGNAKSDVPSDGLDIPPEKCCKILKDGTARGKELTQAQRGMFGACCGQRKKTANLLFSVAALRDDLAKRGLRLGKQQGNGFRVYYPNQKSVIIPLTQLQDIAAGRVPVPSDAAGAALNSNPEGYNQYKHGPGAASSEHNFRKAMKDATEGGTLTETAVAKTKALVNDFGTNLSVTDDRVAHGDAAYHHRKAEDAYRSAATREESKGRNASKIDKVRYERLRDAHKALADFHSHYTAPATVIRVGNAVVDDVADVLPVCNCGGAGGTHGPCPAHGDHGEARGRAFAAKAASATARKLTEGTSGIKDAFHGTGTGTTQGYRHNHAMRAANDALKLTMSGNLKSAAIAHDNAANHHRLAALQHEVTGRLAGEKAGQSSVYADSLAAHEAARGAHVRAARLHSAASEALRIVPAAVRPVGPVGNEWSDAARAASVIARREHAEKNAHQASSTAHEASLFSSRGSALARDAMSHVHTLTASRGRPNVTAAHFRQFHADAASAHAKAAAYHGALKNRDPRHAAAALAHERAATLHRDAVHMIHAPEHELRYNAEGKPMDTVDATPVAVTVPAVQPTSKNFLTWLKNKLGWNDDAGTVNLDDNESLQERLQEVTSAFYEEHRAERFDSYTGDRLDEVPSCHLREVYDTYVIYEENGDLYRQDYHDDETTESVTFDPPTAVEVTYTPTGNEVDNHLTENVWSDAARAAAVEARRASSHAKAATDSGPSRAGMSTTDASDAAHRIGAKADTAQEHQNAVMAHRTAAEEHFGKAQNPRADKSYHSKAARAHDTAADAHLKAFRAKSETQNTNATTTANVNGDDGGSVTTTPETPKGESMTEIKLTPDERRGIIANLKGVITANCSCNGHKLPFLEGETEASLNAKTDAQLYSMDECRKMAANRTAPAGAAPAVNEDALVTKLVSAVGATFGLTPKGTANEVKIDSEDEYLAKAPPSVRATLNHARKRENEDKQTLVQKLVGHITDNAKRQEYGNELLKLEIPELEKRVELLPPPVVNKEAVTFAHIPRNGDGSVANANATNYAGAAGAVTGVASEQPAEDQPALAAPTYNFAAYVAERQGKVLAEKKAATA